MGKFRQFSTELLPFIRLENWFLCSISLKFCQISTEFLPLIYVKKNGFNALSWAFFLADCLQILYTS